MKICIGRRAVNSIAAAILVMLRTAAPAALLVVASSALAQDNVIATAALPRDLSPVGHVRQCRPVVKAVLIGLAFASVVTWTVWLAKTIEIVVARRRVRAALTTLGSARHAGGGRERIARRTAPAGGFLDAAVAEMRLSADTWSAKASRSASPRGWNASRRPAARRIMRGTGVLATIGATAPFVGLFGTVWGIMNSFIGISKSQTTNLAVVAPGIAEALLATAFGLAAAIPAVVIYNVFARSIAGYRALLGDASAEVLRLVEPRPRPPGVPRRPRAARDEPIAAVGRRSESRS